MISTLCTASLARSLVLTALSLPNAVPQWQPTFQGGERLDGTVYELLRHDDGTGPVLYAGGDFLTAGGRDCSYVARWNGTSWRPLGRGTDGRVGALAFYDDGLGGGEKLYVGGNFQMAGTVAASNIACWDGERWSALALGVNGGVGALEVFDDGTGPALYVGGWFNDASGVDVFNVAKWDGQQWEPVGDGIFGVVTEFEVFDDGDGPALYIGGALQFASHPSANGVAVLRNGQWAAVGSSLGSGVRELAVYDDGSGKGPQLYAAGNTGSFPWSPRPFKALARFDGTDWLPVGQGIDGPTFFGAAALEVFDDGSGSKLYIAGSFTEAGGQPVNRIVAWDGSNYAPLGSGIGGSAHCLGIFPSPGGAPGLFVGGEFTVSGGGDPFLACWAP